jgi:hypothetical protein
MKKTIILIAVIIVAIIAIVVWRGGSVPVVNEDGTLSGDYSVRDIIKVNQSLQCDLRNSDASSSITGSVVIAEGKARGDFDITSEQLEAPFASHFILDGDTVYTWTSLANIGYKTGAGDNEPQGGIVNVGDKAPYNCRAWNADLTRFQLPSGISFQELK